MADQTDATNHRPERPLQNAVEELARIGAAWARYGLTIGETALKTSADTLAGTARVLHELAAGVERKE